MFNMAPYISQKYIYLILLQITESTVIFHNQTEKFQGLTTYSRCVLKLFSPSYFIATSNSENTDYT